MEDLKVLFLGEGLIPSLFMDISTSSTINFFHEEKNAFKVFNYLVGKVSKQIKKVIKSNDFLSVKSNLEELISKEYIYWDIKPLPHILKPAGNSIAGHWGKCMPEEVYQFTYNQCEEDPILTIVNDKSYRPKQALYSMSRSSLRFNFIDISETLALILIYNALMEYTRHNQERVDNLFNKTCLTVNKRGSKDKSSCFNRDYFIKPSNGLSKDSFHVSFIINVLKDMYGLAENISTYLEYSEENTRTYAASYQQKKNIPGQVLEKMVSTSFNQYFSEVEIDEEMDLTMFEKVELEYKKYNYMFPSNSASLRFRRLGKYRAAGIYFPFYNAVCVDIHNVYSLIHEVFHWLDYNYYDLIGDISKRNSYKSRISSGYDFSQIVDIYKQLMTEYIDSLAEDDPIREQWLGKSKYSRRYYFETSEIFARLGELYFEDKFGESILWNTNRLGYPRNDEFKILYHEFYDSIFEKVAKRENVSRTVHIEYSKEQYVAAMQLSLFKI